MGSEGKVMEGEIGRSCSSQREAWEEQGIGRDVDVSWSLSWTPCGLRSGGGRWGPATVKVFDIKHDELSALVRDALQDVVALVVLKNLLHVLQVLF